MAVIASMKINVKPNKVRDARVGSPIRVQFVGSREENTLICTHMIKHMQRCPHVFTTCYHYLLLKIGRAYKKMTGYKDFLRSR